MRQLIAAVVLLGIGTQSNAFAETPDNGGPYNVEILAGGTGVSRPIDTKAAAADAPSTMSGWVRAKTDSGVLFALGDGPAACRCLELEQGRLVFRDGAQAIVAKTSITQGEWTHVSAVADGKTVALFINGREVAHGVVHSAAVSNRISVAPTYAGRPHFGGELVGLTLDDTALSTRQITELSVARPDFDLVHMWKVGSGWEWQNRANTGLWRPQDPWTLPKSKIAADAPVAKPLAIEPRLQKVTDNRWQINGWEMIEVPKVTADGKRLSQPNAQTTGWYKATVPGTVLQTLVDRGVYPDPYRGLNNLVIPEKLSRQDYWYRTEFELPTVAAGKLVRIALNGVNYSSEVWVNGTLLGRTKGAFIRGDFAFSPVSGINVIAIKVSPPPHPGIPHEQSIRGGVGENGGQLAIDGPTFVATEGWDWIPGIRDRNTGIWQNVELVATAALTIGDPQIISDLPLPRIDSADLYVRIPVTNRSEVSSIATVTVGIADAQLQRTVTIAPGITTVIEFSPATNPELTIRNPKLWWPNGYGAPVLHMAQITVAGRDGVSDRRAVRFGIREVSYDLGLFDSTGTQRRLQVQTTDGALAGTKLIDVSHSAIKETPTGWAASLTTAGEASKAVTPVTDYSIPEPHLAIRINGVRIAARGGNWGMDDAMKRISRASLEPYFRLERDAHLNIIRNWMGTNTEPEFYDLADEYGLMVLNDFWQSTQNFQVEPQDPQLFLQNARDTISRYRNHPSIILWFGRNEGVPYPQLNEGLDNLVQELDGTRWYTGSSNVVNLQYSGPYNYRQPEGYFTDLATGFSVETGTPSLSTLESIQSYTPRPDQWPLSDSMAYHDWHFAGNGDTKTFMQSLRTRFGPGTSLPDFERKAQMMNLETHQAMFEGLMAHIWTKNTGRLLWMSHPSWPSNAWQLYSWDYDTHAAYYGAKKAAEPLHIQLNLPDNMLAVVNTTQSDQLALMVIARVTDLAGRELFSRTAQLSAKANSVTNLAAIPLTNLFESNGMVLVSLKLKDAAGQIVSNNFYWRGKDESSYMMLNSMPEVDLSVDMSSSRTDGKDTLIQVTLRNSTQTPALAAKLTLLDEKGARILPAFYTDNYVSLMPGETRRIEIRYPVGSAGLPRVSLRGWNVVAKVASAR